ncbi:hypothetical protein [Nonomuraea monospora]|uniref:hypothetical protein n=1 Tax=Nonomuraea monospora TaxID=568818 RepID=UPI003CD0BEEA
MKRKKALKGLYDRSRLRGHTAEVLAVRIGRQSDGTRVVVSGSSDGTVRVWDLDSGRLIGKPLWSKGSRHVGSAWTQL